MLTTATGSLALAAALLAPPADTAPSPMAPLARMIGGAWQATFESGTSMYETWSWGAGRQSIQMRTTGHGADGSPWRAFSVWYWHPDAEEIRMVARSPWAEGVSEGVLVIDETKAQVDFALHQRFEGNLLDRTMRAKWTFLGPNQYRDTLQEANAQGDYGTLIDPVYTRIDAAPPLNVEAPPLPATLQPLAPWIDGSWSVDTTGFPAEFADALAPFAHVHTTIERVPLCETVVLRAIGTKADGTSVPLLDAFAFHHVGEGALRYLVLFADGRVWEGGPEDRSAPDGETHLGLQFWTTGDDTGEHLFRALVLGRSADQRHWLRTEHIIEGERRKLLELRLKPGPDDD